MAAVERPRATGTDRIARPVLAAAVLAIAAAAACQRRPSADEVFAHARNAFQKGRLRTAIRLAEPFTAPGADAAQRLRFGLLALEAWLEEGRPPPAPLAALVSAASAEPRVRARQARLRVQLARLEGHGVAPALAAAEAALAPGDASARLDLLLVKSQVFAARGDLPGAQAAAQSVVDSASGPALAYWRVAALNRVAMIHLQQQRFSDALALVTRAEQDARTSGLEGLLARSRLNQAVALRRLGDFVPAEQRLQAILTAGWEQEDLRAHVFGHGERGNLRSAQRRWAEALQDFEQAAASAGAFGPRAAFDWILNMANAQILLGRWADADASLQRAARLPRLEDDATSALYLQWHRARLALQSGDYLAAERGFRLVVGGAGALRTLRWQAEAGLAAALVHQGRRREADAQYRAALASVRDSRLGLVSLDHRVTYLEHLGALYNGFAELLLAEGRGLEALNVIEESRGQLLGAPLAPPRTPAAWQALARRLDGVLLVFWVSRQRSLLWTIGPRGITQTLLPGEAALRALVEEYRTFIQNSLRDPRGIAGSPGHRLYQALLGPVATTVAGARALVIVPDGPLHALPFAALIAPDDRYLIEHHGLAVAPALRLLPGQLAPPRGRSAARVLALGDPLDGGPAFPRLAHAGRELRSLSARFGDRATVFAGAEAQPAAYLHAPLESFDVIHFAAHGAVNDTSALDSTIVLSAGSAGNRLSVREVLQHPINASVVTVSSCRSAGGRSYAGEGLVGFSWGFLGAGARTVIAGLWDVGDESTPELMDVLYERLATGASGIAALRAAQLAMIASPRWRTPFFWAAFAAYVGPGRVPPTSARIVKDGARIARD
jgi:CHAT domain-containing protein/tetratricopeptide (TPR) repeat protein